MLSINERKHGATDVSSEARKNKIWSKDPVFNKTNWEIPKIEIWKYSACAKKGGQNVDPPWLEMNQNFNITKLWMNNKFNWVIGIL